MASMKTMPGLNLGYTSSKPLNATLDRLSCFRDKKCLQFAIVLPIINHNLLTLKKKISGKSETHPNF